MTEKKREEVDEQYKWDLTSIYKNKEAFENDYQVVVDRIKAFKKWAGKTTKTAANLYQSNVDELEISRKLEKMYTYSSMMSDIDTSDNKNQELKGKVINLYNDFSLATSFVMPEFMALDYKDIEQFYLEEPRLKENDINFRNAYRYKKHTLNNESEKLLATLDKAMGKNSSIHSLLTDSDMTFGTIHDDCGQEITLTDTNYRIYIESTNRTVRKAAFDTLYKYYAQFKNTIAATLAGNVDEEITLSKVRNYKNSFEASLFNDSVDTTVYNMLLNTVNNNLDVLYKYYDLKRDMLGLDKLHLYDIYVDLIKESNISYNFNEAKELVSKAMMVLGQDYVSDLEKAYTEKWIDIYPNIGKRGGAYSGGSYDTYSFVLLNFQNKLDDVSTLAHELGHSMHSFYTRANNSYQYGDYKIFVAEVASTVNELLLAKYMLKNSTSKNEKLTILNKLMDLFKGTIYRQTMFAEFEKDIHSSAEAGVILTSDTLCDKYYKLNKKYFGSNVIIDEAIKYEWERIPHLFYNFYVYKYATGLSAACKIVTDILSGKENAQANYLTFLKSGSTKTPLELLKVAGVDMLDKNVYESAIKMFDEIIKEFKKLAATTN